MQRLWELFKDNNDFLPYQKYIEYIANWIRDEYAIKRILFLIGKNKGMYASELIEYEDEDFTERQVTTSLQKLYSWGLIRIQKKIGRIIVYELTYMGRDCVRKLKEIRQKGR